MIFEKIIKNIFENGTDSFNSGSIVQFKKILHENVIYYTPEIQTENFYTPEKRILNRDNVLKYWDWLIEEYNSEMTGYEYLKIGKTSLVRCEYAKQGYTIDSELQFDEYGKVLKIIHSNVKKK